MHPQPDDPFCRVKALRPVEPVARDCKGLQCLGITLSSCFRLANWIFEGVGGAVSHPAGYVGFYKRAPWAVVSSWFLFVHSCFAHGLITVLSLRFDFQILSVTLLVLSCLSFWCRFLVLELRSFAGVSCLKQTSKTGRSWYVPVLRRWFFHGLSTRSLKPKNCRRPQSKTQKIHQLQLVLRVLAGFTWFGGFIVFQSLKLNGWDQPD